jgi:subtilisin-like proprotein convertase family protein
MSLMLRRSALNGRAGLRVHTPPSIARPYPRENQMMIRRLNPRRGAASFAACAVAAAALLLHGTPNAVGAPSAIRYTGELTASNGLPYDGMVDVQVAVYAAPNGGSPLWQGASTPVDVIAGVLEVDLDGNALAAHLAADSTLYLELSVSGEVLSPRQQLTSVPFATQAGNASALGGMPPSAFLKSNTPVPPSTLPTNGIGFVSNGALNNEFSNVTTNWGGSPLNIPDAPGAAAQVSVTTAESGDAYLTDITVTTGFTLSFQNSIEMILYPPPGAGVGPITLVNGPVGAAPQNQVWTPGNTPALAALLNKAVVGQWSLTVKDTDDNAAPGVSVGQITAFSVSYDVVRSDHLQVAGRLDVAGPVFAAGDMSVAGTLAVGGAVEPRAIIYQGFCTTHGGSTDFIDYCLDGTAINTAGAYLSANSNGLITFTRAGLYEVEFYAWHRNSCGSRHDVHMQLNNNLALGSEVRAGSANSEGHARVHKILNISAGNTVKIQARSNCNSSEPWRSYHHGPTWSSLTVRYLGHP